MPILKIAAAALLAWPFCALAEGSSKSCEFADCPPGTRAVTYATRQEPFYACPSPELSDFVNTARVAASLYGTAQDKSREPEYTGQTGQLLNALRQKAGVDTLQQAIDLCAAGQHRSSVVVLENPNQGKAVFVATGDKKTFWLPRAHVYRR